MIEFALAITLLLLGFGSILAISLIRASAPRPWWPLWIGMMVGVTVVSLVVYLQIGTPQAWYAEQTTQVPSLQSQLMALRQRLETHPEDAEGWLMLARVETLIEDFPAAAKSYAYYHALTPGNPDSWLAQAQALVMIGDSAQEELVRTLLHQVLEQRTDSVVALWLLGQLHAQNGERESALIYWNRLLPLIATEKGFTEQLQAQIEALGNVE